MSRWRRARMERAAGQLKLAGGKIKPFVDIYARGGIGMGGDASGLNGVLVAGELGGGPVGPGPLRTRGGARRIYRRRGRPDLRPAVPRCHGGQELVPRRRAQAAAPDHRFARGRERAPGRADRTATRGRHRRRPGRGGRPNATWAPIATGSSRSSRASRRRGGRSRSWPAAIPPQRSTCRTACRRRFRRCRRAFRSGSSSGGRT